MTRATGRHTHDRQSTTPSLGHKFRAARPTYPGVHLDSAGAGRMSDQAFAAISEHLYSEARIGAYPAAEERKPTLDRCRGQLSSLIGFQADEVALLESASVALTSLLSAWRFPADATVAVAPDEWGPNLERFRAAGMAISVLPCQPDGLVDLGRLEKLLRSSGRPDLVHIDHVPSHRPLVQPAAEIARLCNRSEVPLWVDAAQAVGQVAAARAAAAVYGPGRKWLTGPRGTGFLAVAARWWPKLGLIESELDPDVPFIQRLESHERSVAGFLGLCAAVEEHLSLGPENVKAALTQVGIRTRQALEDVPGWRVVPAVGGEPAITALEPGTGQDVLNVRERLRRDHGILTTAAQPARSPLSMRSGLLRVSPHVDVTDSELDALVQALHETS